MWYNEGSAPCIDCQHDNSSWREMTKNPPFKPDDTGFRLSWEYFTIVCTSRSLPSAIRHDHPISQCKDGKQYRDKLLSVLIIRLSTHSLRRSLDFTPTPPIHQGIKLLPKLVLDDDRECWVYVTEKGIHHLPSSSVSWVRDLVHPR